MAIERRDGGVYCYSYRRVNGRVVKVYEASGDEAEFAERIAQSDRERRLFARLDRDEEVDAARGEVDAGRAWFTRIDKILAAALKRCGWHRQRWGWRRKRGAKVKGLANVDQLPSWDTTELAAEAGGLDPETEAKAKKGDVAALRAVEKYLDNPAAVRLWGDFGRHVLCKWIKLYAGDEVVMHRAMVKYAAQLREQLAGPNPSVLVQLLAERVVIAWVFATWADAQYVMLVDRLQPPLAKMHFQRMSLGQRNLMAAVKTLAKVRRVKMPDVLALVNVTPPALAK